MAHSKRPHPLGANLSLAHMRDVLAFTARTPGSLGTNDGADPTRFSLVGDTPGPLGWNDHASPFHLNVARLELKPLADPWFDELRVHIPPEQQIARTFPAGSKDDVLDKLADFLVEREGYRRHPYWPGGQSGVTIGVGYDLSQHAELTFRQDWAKLDNAYSPSLGLLGDFKLASPSIGGLSPIAGNLPKLKLTPPKLLSAVDRLAAATQHKLTPSQSDAFVATVSDIVIPKDLALAVLGDSLSSEYEKVVRTWPGLPDLPLGVQVALLSIAFNRGVESPVRSKKNKHKATSTGDSRWEMRELRFAIQSKDIVWIYWYIESMRRVWAKRKEGGLIVRRNKELDLIYPYVRHDIQREAFRQVYGF